LLILPSLSLPPLECCFGTKPIQAEKYALIGKLLEYVAAVADLAVARAAYRATCRRWPDAKITLRQGARVVEKNWSPDAAAN
jgi:hypothetical protein